MTVETKKHQREEAAHAFREIIGALAKRDRDHHAVNIRVMEEFLLLVEHAAPPLKTDSREAKPK